MAHFFREVEIDVAETFAWDALRDLGSLHTRLVKGFVTDCRLEGDVRIVKFANGLEARENIIDVSDTEKRVAWSATGGRLTHHNASAQVQRVAPHRVKVIWTVDLLPHSMAQAIAGMVEAGLQSMKHTLEANAKSAA